jgi:glycosyltransferase involved in cell wall biosynthesis
MQRVLILCPLYNDEASFRFFAAKVKAETEGLEGYAFSLLVVNDGSDTQPQLSAPLPLTVIHLRRNIGHQKAIAIGLSYAHHNMQSDSIIVMDADGEDKPEDIKELLLAAVGRPGIVFAQRASRQENARFKLFYRIYKSFFRVLTGRTIAFGNFMLLPKEQVARLVYNSDIWSHLAGAILRSRTPFHTVAAHRGKRYSGSSQMSFSALLLHGLGAIAVFIDVIATRLLVFSIAMILLSVVGILVILGVRFFTDAAIPGWATTAFSSMLIVLLQSFLLSLFTIFLYLSAQSQRKFIPANHYGDYLESVQSV